MLRSSTHRKQSNSPVLVQVLRASLVLVGIALIIWALAVPGFRDSEGNLIGTICLPLSAGVGVVFLGVMLSSSLAQAAFWLALALIGQAADLQMIRAGKTMSYQHYRLLDTLTAETPPLVLLIVALQIAIVLAALIVQRKRIWTWLREHFKLWQILGIAAVTSLFAATVSHQLSVYLQELVLAAFLQLVSLGNILLAALSIPAGSLVRLRQKIDRLWGKVVPQEEKPAGLDQFAWLAAVWVFLLAAFLNLVSYQRHPHIPDEVAYIVQARFLAAGKLTMPAPPVPDAFDFYLMQFDGNRWYPAPPPGWPLVLAIGEKFGAGWLVNPILGGVNILLIYLLLTHLYDRRLARISVFLLCFSPWYVFMAMNYMTHTFTLTCALVAAVGVIAARNTGQSRWAWLAGFALGMMSLIRPLEGLLMAVLIGLWAIGIGGKRLKLFSVAALVIGTALTAGLVLPYNRYLTGSFSNFPINVYTDQRFGKNSNAYGFGPDRGMGWPIDPNPGHSPLDATINADLNTFSINIELFGWGTGSLFLIALMLLAGKYRTSDLLMLAVMAAVFGVFFFYYFSGGPDFGARYWYLMIVPLAALSARGIQTLEQKLSLTETSQNPHSARVMAVIFSLCLMAIVNYFPWRAIDKYFHYLDMRPDIRYLAEEYHFGKSLVLIQGESQPDYASAAVYNPLDLESDAPIYVWDRSPEVRQAVLQAYPDRTVWIIAGPTITQAGFQVVEGPVPASQLLGRAAGPILSAK